jgi:hypothetical protein
LVPVGKKKTMSLLDSIDHQNSRTISLAGPEINKAAISVSDSTMWVGQNKYQDHRIFGYQKPDTSSKRMILISVFTNDVEDNPFKCPLGSYYHSGSIDDITLKYLSNENEFIKVKALKNDGTETIVYILKKWTEFAD